MTNEKKFIYTSLIMLLISIIFLAWLGNQKMSGNQKSNWWSAYFDSTEKVPMTFVIENHSNGSQFKWELYEGKNQVESGTADVQIGKKVQITPKMDIARNVDYTLIISNQNGSKEIYNRFK